MGDEAIRLAILGKLAWTKRQRASFDEQPRQSEREMVDGETCRTWINTELAKKSPRCLDYIVLHELIHLIERNHQAGFTALMDRHMPMWRHVRAELNAAPLAHGSWEY